MALDGLFNSDARGSNADFLNLFDALGKGKVRIVPSIECAAPTSYSAVVHKVIGRYAPGLVVKARVGQVPSVAGWVSTQGWKPQEVDLVVTAGQIEEYGDDVQFADFVVHAISAALPNPPPWRSVTLASSAAPRDYSSLALGRNVVARMDWHLWKRVSQKVPFALDYGDFAISHPDMTEPPGVAMTRASVSVRYSLDDDWIILKGSSTTGPKGKPMGQQFRNHAKALVADPQFDGLAACWGDQRIQEIAKGTGKSGSRTTWVEIGVNRHLSLVADRLP